MIRIALDASGGDCAPERPVAGALEAHESLCDTCEIVLVGQQSAVEAELKKQGGADVGIRVVDAPDIIGMEEKPLAAVRGKKHSSISIGIGLHRDGGADAFISAGNTGAMMAASLLMLGRTPGIERPPICTAFPTPSGPVFLLDGGANVDCSSRDILGFARLGSVYARDAFDRVNPKVGLLNVGEEEEKGNAVCKEAHGLLSADASLNFVGNIEGGDILKGVCDIIVCDGFVGNIVLKFYESAGRILNGLLQQELTAETLETEGVAKVVAFLDYSTYGGAPLLGVRGLPVICHGRSSPRAFANAIRVAVHAAGSGLSRHIEETFADGALP